MATTSAPDKATGMAFRWMGVGIAVALALDGAEHLGRRSMPSKPPLLDFAFSALRRRPVSASVRSKPKSISPPVSLGVPVSTVSAPPPPPPSSSSSRLLAGGFFFPTEDFAPPPPLLDFIVRVLSTRAGLSSRRACREVPHQPPSRWRESALLASALFDSSGFGATWNRAPVRGKNLARREGLGAMHRRRLDFHDIHRSLSLLCLFPFPPHFFALSSSAMAATSSMERPPPPA